ncbi:hypothetical protein OUZ56_000023 [Daphnia magna]|uniref:Uncharacterized protein n=1 Tax=Daphnia magna TaxID=35525 RepID=A0ABQ9ZYP0_9CRUS|nr:hypothetical protein OUZ56_000023 [Daphnia magna]
MEVDITVDMEADTTVGMEAETTVGMEAETMAGTKVDTEAGTVMDMADGDANAFLLCLKPETCCSRDTLLRDSCSYDAYIDIQYAPR